MGTTLVRLTAVAAIAGALLLAGCERPEAYNERGLDDQRIDERRTTEPADTKEVGQEVGEAAREAKEETEEFFEGVREGYGGSGQPEELPQGEREELPKDFPEPDREPVVEPDPTP